MASGLGVHGTPGKCFPIFKAFNQCLVPVSLAGMPSLSANGYQQLQMMKLCYCTRRAQAQSDTLEACEDFKMDYFECIHHKKEFARNKEIHQQKMRNLEVLEHGAHSGESGGGGH
eukprot:7173-Heterococcus_DN1.PRE.1